MKCAAADNLLVLDHFVKYDDIIVELESTVATLNETDKGCHLLLTLPSEYDTVITTLEKIDKELESDFVKSRR